MWRVGVYLILMFALANLPQARLVLSLPSVAGEDKPQAEKGVAEKPAPDETTPDKDKKAGEPRTRASSVRGEAI